MTTVRTEIVAGPSKFDLMLALFDRKGSDTRTVEFKNNDERGISSLVVINGIELEDGSGESWIFKGYVKGMIPSLNLRSPARNCSGYYHSGTRKGWIQLD